MRLGPMMEISVILTDARSLIEASRAALIVDGLDDSLFCTSGNTARRW